MCRLQIEWFYSFVRDALTVASEMLRNSILNVMITLLIMPLDVLTVILMFCKEKTFTKVKSL
jgi:hypothetical protein